MCDCSRTIHAKWQCDNENEKVIQIRVHSQTLNPNPNPNHNHTTKQHAIVSILINIAKCPTYSEIFIRHNVTALCLQLCHSPLQICHQLT